MSESKKKCEFVLRDSDGTEHVLDLGCTSTGSDDVSFMLSDPRETMPVKRRFFLAARDGTPELALVEETLVDGKQRYVLALQDKT